jgi:hypothetical protein
MDDPELEGGVGTEQEFRDVHFTDLYPYLSASGAFIKDRLWYFFSGEYVQVETPVNSLTQTFVAATHGYRAFGKATWQMNPANKLAFSVTLDRTVDENQGLSSVVAPESGYFFKRGGPTYALRETAVFSPSIYLESSLGWFDNNFQRSPTLNPDTNHNGILTVDDRPDLGGNGDGIIQVSEADPGEDFDRDGFYDIFEDKDRNGKLDIGEDLDGDGRLTLPVACEGSQREDMNCNGLLDSEEDKNLDGLIQPNEDTGIPCFDFVLCPQGTLPGTAGNGRFDTEDRNGDGSLDVLDDSGFTPYPFWQDANHNDKVELGEFRSPTPADQPFARDTSGRYSGPNPYEYDDHRTRFTLREDLSIFAGDFGGSHDLKVGAIYEDEGYDGTTTQRPNLRTPRARTASSVVRTTSTTPSSYVAYLGVPVEVEKSATGENYGLFIQDTYKPIPNLTLGLGLRVDQENLSSAGYTFFDPAVQRQQYNALIEMSGVDLTPNGITAAGLCQDPIYNCGATGSALPLDLADLYHDLRVLAPQRFTHHNSEVDILGPFLSGLLPPNADINDLRFNIRQPEPIEIRNTNVAPRLSLTWDPWADGKSKAFASWGRFYDKLFLNSVTLEQGPDTVSRFYAFDKDGLDNEGRPDNQFGGVLSQAAPSGFQVDRNLSTPYTDELTLGFQREIAPEVSLGITYIRRDFQNQLQDIDVNHYTVVDPATGRLADTLGEELVAATFGRVGGQRQPDGIPDLYIRDFFFNRIFRMGNYNQQTYRGVELELVKRLSRKWQMEASYTFSRSKGDAESFLSENGDDPALTEFEPGFLDYDQTHVVKFNATAFLPGDWRLGGNIVYASGLPYSFIQETDSSDDVGYFQGRRLFGYYDYRGFIPENRNIHRNHATYRINVRTEKSFVIGKASSSAFFEVYNLLNTDDLRIYTYDTGVTRLNAVGERDFGRRFQFGIQVSF